MILALAYEDWIRENAVRAFVTVWAGAVVLWLVLDWMGNPNRGRFRPQGPEKVGGFRARFRSVFDTRDARDAEIRETLRSTYGKSSLRLRWSRIEETTATAHDEARLAAVPLLFEAGSDLDAPAPEPALPTEVLEVEWELEPLSEPDAADRPELTAGNGNGDRDGEILLADWDPDEDLLAGILGPEGELDLTALDDPDDVPAVIDLTDSAPETDDLPAVIDLTDSASDPDDVPAVIDLTDSASETDDLPAVIDLTGGPALVGADDVAVRATGDDSDPATSADGAPQRWRPGRDPRAVGVSGRPPKPKTVRTRIWKNHALARPGLGPINLDRLARGRPPRRWNPLTRRFETAAVSGDDDCISWADEAPDPFAGAAPADVTDDGIDDATVVDQSRTEPTGADREVDREETGSAALR